MPEDMSNGYEDAAAEYMAARFASGAVSGNIRTYR